VLLLAIVAPAFGQAQNSGIEQLERMLQQAERQYATQSGSTLNLGERALLEYGGLANFSFLAIDDVNGRTRILRQTDAQLFAHLNLDGAHEFFGRLRYTYRDWNPGDSFDGKGDQAEYPIADRYYYHFDLARALASSGEAKSDINLTLTAGRQFVDWASGLVFSNQLYAVRGTVSYGPIEVEYLAGTTPESTVIDFDSSRPSFDGDTNRGIFAGKLTYTGLAEHRPYIYALHQQDYNNEDNATVFGAPTHYYYSSTYLAAGSTGTLFLPNLVYIVEGIYEFGHGESTSIAPVTFTPIPQRKEDISAWAGKFEFDYLFRDDNLSRLEFEGLFASGDRDRVLDTSNTVGGNTPGTKDTAFNALGFARTGLAFSAPLSNVMSYRLGATTFPLRTRVGMFRDLQIGADVLFLMKMDPSAPLDEPTDNHRYLGTETDFYASWRITSDVSANLRYGVFFPGAGISGNDSPRHFLYTGITYSF
jgi:hypothetical protein